MPHAGDYFLHRKMQDHGREMMRLGGYDRRAASLSRKAIRGLDCERIKAE